MSTNDDLRAEAEANDPRGTSSRFANLNPAEQDAILADAAETRRNLAEQDQRATRPLTLEEVQQLDSIVAPNDRFERRGLGYFAHYEAGLVDMTFDHFHRSGIELIGELSVTTRDPRASADGHLLQGSFNVSAMRTRDSLARLCAERAPAVKVDWRACLEHFCRRILNAERQGEPVVIVGNRPPRLAIPYLLDPMLVRGKSTILFGPEGTGKSLLAAAMTASVYSERIVVPGWRPLGRSNVLVLDWEDDEEEWNDRLARIARGASLPPPEIVYRYGRGSLAEDVDEIARIVSERQIGLLIVDSVSKAAPPGRDGGDPSDTANRLFAALRYIGGTSLLLDHVPKSSDPAGAERPYGSVMKPAWARVTFELAATDDKNDLDILHLVLTNRKRNTGARTPPFGVRVQYDGTEKIVFDDEKMVTKSGAIWKQVTELLGDGAERTYTEIADELGVKVDSVQQAVRRGGFQRIVDPLGITRIRLPYQGEEAA